jgi:hypothetical protein
LNAYVELPGFADIVLEESYVLRISATPGALRFDVDLVLAPSHPMYVRPPSNERDCFRFGTIDFRKVQHLEWGGQDVTPAVDATGTSDYGHIDHFLWDDGLFRLDGDWGRMEIRAAGVSLDIGS